MRSWVQYALSGCLETARAPTCRAGAPLLGTANRVEGLGLPANIPSPRYWKSKSPRRLNVTPRPGEGFAETVRLTLGVTLGV